MQGTLILAILNMKSSYAQEVEESLERDDDIPDTLQWWIGTESAWRIKTFALDHDIHVYSVGPGNEALVQLALDNNTKHYGDVIACQHVLQLTDCEDSEEVQKLFHSIGLASRLEVAPGRFAFWKPDDAKYSTQSQPKR
jgi:hypothetical protein